MSPLTYNVFNLYSFIGYGTYNPHLYTTTHPTRVLWRKPPFDMLKCNIHAVLWTTKLVLVCALRTMKTNSLRLRVSPIHHCYMLEIVGHMVCCKLLNGSTNMNIHLLSIDYAFRSDLRP